MKQSILKFLLGTVISALGLSSEWSKLERITPVKTNLDSLPKAALRESIAFILGEDASSENGYYREATLYYAHNPEAKTNHLVTSCRSLAEVREYLTAHRPGNKLPWGLIHLVSHGNQWTGLSVKVAADSKRTTVARLEEYIQRKKFAPLDKSIADRDTEMFLHGCGVGNNTALCETIARAFGGRENALLVRASKLFEYYASARYGQRVQAERYMANAWFVTYPMGRQPSARQLTRALQDKYQDAPVDWSRALRQTKPEQVGDVYHYTFEVPVKWIVRVHPDSIPNLATRKTQQAWLGQQCEIVDELNGLQIAPEKFDWTFSKIYVNQEGTQVPALWVKGYSTVLCVLQALTDGADENALAKPLAAKDEDSRFYYSTRSDSPTRARDVVFLKMN